MKKQYIKPATEIMNIETEQMMAASFVDGTGTLDINSGGATKPADSKDHGFDLWGDDED